MTMADEVFLLDSPAIEKAVMAHNTEVTRRRRFGKSSLNEIPEVSAGTKKDEYTGPFKLRHIEERTFEICHGVYYNRPNDSNYNIAGNTDLPNAGNVKRQNIILPENRTGADVYLHAIYEDGKYRVEIDFDSYKGFQTIYLGAIRANGEAVQEYREQGTIYFGRQWYL
jgi:hypothetical protein